MLNKWYRNGGTQCVTEFTSTDSNMHGKTWGQIKRENGICGIAFVDGRADLRPITVHEIRFDWEEALGLHKVLQAGGRRRCIMGGWRADWGGR